MVGQTPVAPYTLLDSTTQSGSAYKVALDGNSVAAARIVGRFAPHAQTSANMTVRLDAGSIFNGTTLTEVAAQSTGTITAPVAHPRIDRIVIDNTSGAISVVTGTEAVSPTAPAIPAGKGPVAQVLLQTTTTVISNTIITDERNFGGMTSGGIGGQTSLSSASTCDLGTITSHNVLISGSTTITSFGSSAMTQTPIYLIEFSGTLTLTHNGTSLILPGAANITTAPGDTAVAEYLGSGNWRVRAYTRATGSNLPTGTSVPWNGIFAPSWGLFEDGAAISRSTYANLLNAITGVVTGTTTSGSATITSVGTDLTGLGVEGAPIEGAGIPSATTIASVTSTTITLSAAATGASTAIRIFPHGNGDGSTTFNKPDSRGRSKFGRDNMGGSAAARLTSAIAGSANGARLGATGGEQSHTLVISEVPPDTISIPSRGGSNAAGPAAGAIQPTAITSSFTVSTNGGGQAHNTVPPAMVTNWVIVV